jgi:DNA-binding GntR family transcriptional regulator
MKTSITTVTEQVTVMLRDQIIQGEILPGARLLQNEVASRFRVSSTPVREAFGRLQAEGLLRSDSHRGVQVVSPTLQDIAECYTIRQRLEPLAIEWAIANASPSLFRPLAVLVRRMEEQIGPSEFLSLNHEFHSGLYALSGSNRLNALIDTVRDQAATYLLMLARAKDADLTQIMARADAEHHEILEYCCRGDAQAASNAVQMHLEAGFRDIRTALCEGEEW